MCYTGGMSAPSSRTALVAGLTTAELREARTRMERATAALRAAFAAERPDESTVRAALNDGALFEKLPNPGQRRQSPDAGKLNDLWQYTLDNRRLDLFEALLDADDARAARDIDAPGLVGRVATQAPSTFLNALLARKPNLNQMGPLPLLAYGQHSTCLLPFPFPLSLPHPPCPPFPFPS